MPRARPCLLPNEQPNDDPPDYPGWSSCLLQSGGTVLLDHWKNGYAIHFKGDIDLVTDADRQAEATIVSLIRSRFPDHEILAEEGSGSGGTASSSYRWIIDPLDGTTNYAHWYPHFAVSIAVEQAGAIIVGTVYDPVQASCSKLASERCISQRAAQSLFCGPTLACLAVYRVSVR